MVPSEAKLGIEDSIRVPYQSVDPRDLSPRCVLIGSNLNLGDALRLPRFNNLIEIGRAHV